MREGNEVTKEERDKRDEKMRNRRKEEMEKRKG